MKTTFTRDAETIDRLARFIAGSTRLSMGDRCRQFENDFSAYTGSKHSCLVNSGSSANLLLVQCLKNIGMLRDGDAVGFSAITWSTNVMPLIQLSLRPVPVDCDVETLNSMSWNLLKTLETEPLKAMFITNALGLAGDLDRIRDICQDRGILLFEDNCEALGTEVLSGNTGHLSQNPGQTSRKTGTFGIASTHSFFVAHHLSTVEGGMVVTDHDDLAEALVIARANGWDRNLEPARQQRLRAAHGIAGEFSSKYTFYDLAFNVRPTEITGFLGSDQLRYIVDNTETRARNFHRFNDVAEANPELTSVRHDHLAKVSSFAVAVVAKTPELRDQYLDRFVKHGIEIRPIIAGNIQSQPFYRKYVTRRHDLPGAEHLDRCGFYCGNYPELDEHEIDTIEYCLTGDTE